MNIAITTLAVSAARHENTPCGAAMETTLIAAILADRHQLAEERAIDLAEQDRWDDRVQAAALTARQLINQARLSALVSAARPAADHPRRSAR